MSLCRLIYASRVSEGVKNKDIEAILTSSQANNKRLHVTGSLFYNYKNFVQCLEGSREHINRIYQHIAEDKRHQMLTIIDFREIHQRDFPQWSMAYVSFASDNNSLFLEYSNSDIFNPFEMSAESCYQLLLRLRHTAPKIE